MTSRGDEPVICVKFSDQTQEIMGNENYCFT